MKVLPCPRYGVLRKKKPFLNEGKFRGVVAPEQAAIICKI
jgi:hypothetical protein